MSSGVAAAEAATSCEPWQKAGNSARPSDAPLSLWLSPTGGSAEIDPTEEAKIDGCNENNVHQNINGGKAVVGGIQSVGVGHSPAPRENQPTTAPGSRNASTDRRYGTISLAPTGTHEAKPGCKKTSGKPPRSTPPTLNADAFRARLHRRLHGISIQDSGRRRADRRSERSDVGAGPAAGIAEQGLPPAPPSFLPAAAGATAAAAAATTAGNAADDGGSKDFGREQCSVNAGKAKAVRSAVSPEASAVRAFAATTASEPGSEGRATALDAESSPEWEWEKVTFDWTRAER